MNVHAAWILHLGGLVWAVYAELDNCIPTKKYGLTGVKFVHCLVTRNDVKLVCPPEKIIVLSALQFGVKSKSTFCMKRVLTSNDEFCCAPGDDDVLYDGHCLQNVWTKEDKIHYQHFVRTTLESCVNRSHCVLKARMFGNLQKEIPTTETYSTYFQVVYHCIKAPSNPVQLCAPRSVSGKEVHFMDNFTTPSTDNKTCSCTVRSEGISEVIVRAVDIRSSHRDLILTAQGKVTNISTGDLPIFGFRKILSAKKVKLTVRHRLAKAGDNVWIQVSSSNGRNVHVTCGETAAAVERTTTLYVAATPSNIIKKTVFWGYWPLIYIGVGSILTLILIVCSLGGYFLCRRSSRRECQRPSCGHPCPADFHQDHYSPPYATVLDENPHLQSPRTATYMSIQTMLRDKQYMARSPAIERHHRPDSEPPLPPSNIPLNSLGASSVATTRPRVSPGTDNNVSQLEAFLKC